MSKPILTFSIVLFFCINLLGQDTTIIFNSNVVSKFRNFSFATNEDNLIMLSSEQGTNSHVKVWDKYFRLQGSFPVVNRKTDKIALSPDGVFMAKTISANKFEIWNIQTNKLIETIESLLDIRTMTFSPNGKELAICGYFQNVYYRNSGFGNTTKKGVIELIDFSKAKSHGQLSRSRKSINGLQCIYATYSPDGKYIMGIHPEYNELNILIWDAKTGKKIKSILLDNPNISRAKFIPNTNYIIYADYKHFHIYDFVEKQEVKKIHKLNWHSSQFDINENGQIVYPTYDGFEVSNLNAIHNRWRVTLPKAPIVLQFHPVYPFVVFTTDYGTIEIWDYQQKKRIFNILSTKTFDGYGIYNPDGYYFGSKEGVKTFLIQKDGETHSFEKFDLIYNRPDKVFSNLPFADTNEITAYENLVRSRQKLISKTKEEGKETPKQIDQNLNQDWNDSNNNQNIHFVGIGISDYLEDKSDLNFADKDIEDLSDFLNKNVTNNIEIHSTTLLNKNATRAKILGLENKLKTLVEEDILILYFSGHGGLNTAGEWCFLPHDYETGKTGITDQMILEILNNCSARRKVVFIDACYAGERSSSKALQSISGKTGNSKGAIEDDETESQIPLERIKRTFNDIRNDTDAIIIAASRGNEVARENPNYGNGIFTYFLMKGLEDIVADTNLDQSISTNELVNYIYNKLDDLNQSEQLRGIKIHAQRPNFKRENATSDFNIWKRKRTKVKYDQLIKQ